MIILTDSERLEQIIKESGLKKSYIARQLKLSPYGLQLKINNRHEFKASEIIELCGILGISSLREREAIFFGQKVD